MNDHPLSEFYEDENQPDMVLANDYGCIDQVLKLYLYQSDEDCRDIIWALQKAYIPLHKFQVLLRRVKLFNCQSSLRELQNLLTHAFQQENPVGQEET